jgi:hypothetical protein
MTSLLALAAAIAANPAAATPPAAEREPAIVREADGSFTIREPIYASYVPLDEATDGLVEDFDGDRAYQPSEKLRIKRQHPPSRIEREVERAFEEAIDQARDAED